MNNTKTNQLTITSSEKRSDVKVKQAFREFLSEPIEYRSDYLQAKFTKGFDGYSFLGQEDSTNQYETDLLHSFVLSKFSEPSAYPVEFHDFLSQEWDTLIEEVRELELEMIRQLDIPGLTDFHQRHIDYMLSCNYYPALDQVMVQPDVNTRLSNHKDISLFTVFVFGLDEGMSYRDQDGLIRKVGAQYTIVLFPGYLLEYLTKGKYKAFEHEVALPEHNLERFSFAFFSVPKPNQNFTFDHVVTTSEEYYQAYLALF
ncbi:MAG: hypothetical protein OCD76_16050 [Reichenbachiella sp.]